MCISFPVWVFQLPRQPKSWCRWSLERRSDDIHSRKPRRLQRSLVEWPRRPCQKAVHWCAPYVRACCLAQHPLQCLLAWWEELRSVGAGVLGHVALVLPFAGNVFKERGQYEEALQHYTKALQLKEACVGGAGL